MPDETTLYCYVHPNRETQLRCNQCERPICDRCAVLTPTGYRCRECIRSQQKTFETAKTIDFLLAPAVAAILAFVGSLLVRYLGFFTLFLAPLAGMIIAEGVRWISGKRRSPLLVKLISGAALLGSLPLLILLLIQFILRLQNGGGLSVWGLLPLIYQAAYALIATSSVYYRLGGIRIN